MRAAYERVARKAQANNPLVITGVDTTLVAREREIERERKYSCIRVSEACASTRSHLVAFSFGLGLSG